MEESMVQITPTLIFRVSSSGIEIVDVRVDEGRALLVFMNPEQAETFRRETGCYPESEGFKVRVVDSKRFPVITEAASFELVALRSGLDTVSIFEADTFGEILIEALDETSREAGTLGTPPGAIETH